MRVTTKRTGRTVETIAMETVKFPPRRDPATGRFTRTAELVVEAHATTTRSRCRDLWAAIEFDGVRGETARRDWSDRDVVAEDAARLAGWNSLHLLGTSSTMEDVLFAINDAIDAATDAADVETEPAAAPDDRAEEKRQILNRVANADRIAELEDDLRLLRSDRRMDREEKAWRRSMIRRQIDALING